MRAGPFVRTVPAVAQYGEDGTAPSMVVDLACGAGTRETSVKVAAQWCRLRPIPVHAVERVTKLLSEATSYGLRFGPQNLRLRVVWVGQRRILVALTWRGCGHGTALSTVDLERTAETFESLADVWGFEAGRTGQTHWFVVDAAS